MTDGTEPQVKTVDPRERVAKLLSDNEGMVWFIARKVCPRNRPDLLDDIASEVRLQFLKATATYNDESEAKFTTYAYRATLLRALTMLARERLRGIYVPDGKVRKCDVQPPVDYVRDIREHRPLDIPAPKQEPQFEVPPDFWDKIKRRLSPVEYELIWLMYKEGLSGVEASKRMYKCYRYGTTVVHKILRKLKRLSPDLKQLLEK